MLLTTPRLVLREWEPDMAAALCALSQDPENRRFLPDEVFETPQAAENAITSLLQNRKTGEGPQVLAVLQKDGPLVGHVELCPLEGTADWEIGYHIGAPWRGRGYAAEGLRAFLPAMLPERVHSPPVTYTPPPPSLAVLPVMLPPWMVQVPLFI